MDFLHDENAAKAASGIYVHNPFERGCEILRFYGEWASDRGGGEPQQSSSYASAREIRRFNIHFYVEDETLEMVEIHNTNCGRYKAPLFLKRTKLRKV